MAHDILTILAEGPRRPVEIRGMFGFASANYFTAQYLTPMRKAGYIAQVGGANPHSLRQDYKIMFQGRGRGHDGDGGVEGAVRGAARWGQRALLDSRVCISHFTS